MNPPPEYDPDDSPSMSILALLMLAAIIVGIGLALSSCATLNAIPFSVSYNDPIGGVTTFTKPAVPKVRYEK